MRRRKNKSGYRRSNISPSSHLPSNSLNEDAYKGGYSGGTREDDRQADTLLWISSIENGVINIYTQNYENIAGFQFKLNGINITDLGSDGVALDNGLTIDYNSSTNLILGHSVDGSVIPPVSGLLLSVEFNATSDDEVCFSNHLFSNPDGDRMRVDYPWGRCMDIDEGEYDDEITLTYEFKQGWNMFGVPLILDDYSVVNIFSNNGNCEVDGIIGEGIAGMFAPNFGGWIGTLMNLDPEGGYHVHTKGECTMELTGLKMGINTSNSIVHYINEGPNYISFDGPSGTCIFDTNICNYEGVVSVMNTTFDYNTNEVTHNVHYCLPGKTYGNINIMDPKSSYWIISDEDFSFEWTYPETPTYCQWGGRDDDDEHIHMEFNLPNNEPPPTLSFTEAIQSVEDQINNDTFQKCWWVNTSGIGGPHHWEWSVGPLECANGSKVCDFSDCASYHVYNCCGDDDVTCPGSLTPVQCCQQYGGGARPCSDPVGPSQVDEADYTDRFGREGKKPGDIFGLD